MFVLVICHCYRCLSFVFVLQITSHGSFCYRGIPTLKLELKKVPQTSTQTRSIIVLSSRSVYTHWTDSSENYQKVPLVWKHLITCWFQYFTVSVVTCTETCVLYDGPSTFSNSCHCWCDGSVRRRLFNVYRKSLQCQCQHQKENLPLQESLQVVS